jgi:hypothetical protein
VRAVPVQNDLTPWLWGCDVGLNPVTTGAGSNVKLPTYLAAGLDVVTTPFGARGFERLADHVTAAGLEGFADAIAGCGAGVRDEAARANALASYAWSAQAERLHAAYGTALAARGTAAGSAR